MTVQSHPVVADQPASTRPVLAGRAATPPPPNVGISSLMEQLRPQPEGPVTGRSSRILVAVASAELFDALVRQHRVFPAVPGLAEDLVRSVKPDAVVLDVGALDAGPWAGALAEHAHDLLAALEGLVEAAAEVDARYYVVNPTGQDLPDTLVNASTVLRVENGSPLYAGVPEGAPPSRLQQALNHYVEVYRPG